MSESCCSPSERATRRPRCAACGAAGNRVDRLTVAAMTSGVVPPDQPYGICRQRGCPVVYFGDDGTTLTVADMNVSPGFKSAESDALVCYCFQYRRGDIEAELRAQGSASIPDRIRAEVKAGNCACEVRNPAGKCCLGEVQRAVDELGAGLATVSRGE